MMIKNNNEPTGAVYEINTEFISGIASKCSSISSSISGATINIPPLVAKHAGGILAAISDKSEISNSLSGLKSLLLRSIANAGDRDIDYNDDISWDVLAKIDVLSNKNGMKKASVEDFIKMGYEVINNKVTIGEYTYDIKSMVQTL